jgi:hypothetical protein
MQVLDILFVMGFSGVGKSHFCKYVAEQNDWLYFLIDQWGPDGKKDGLTYYGLDKAWDIFEKLDDPSALINAIIKKVDSEYKMGCVFDFPSTRMLSQWQVALLGNAAKTVYLVANPKFCMDSCSKRSTQNKTTYYGDEHWYRYNGQLLNLLASVKIRRHCIYVLDESGKRKSPKQLFREMKNLKF